MKILIGGKGGSGKSTVTAVTARALRDRGFRVLVVDMDESNSGVRRSWLMSPRLGLSAGWWKILPDKKQVADGMLPVLLLTK